MELDFTNNYEMWRSYCTRNRLGVTSTISVMEQAQTLNTMVSVVRCTTVLKCAPFALSGPHCKCAATYTEDKCGGPDAHPRHSFTRAPVTLEGPTFLPMASAPMLLSFPGAAAVPAPMQSGAMPPMADLPLLSQSTPYRGAYMASPTWPMYMPSFLPLPQMDRPQIDLNVSY